MSGIFKADKSSVIVTVTSLQAGGIKAVSDIISPVSGKVTEINEELLDSPEKINEDPYGAWFVKVTDVEDTEELLDADEYDKFVKEEA